MCKKLTLWMILFVIGLLIVLCCMEISRYVSDVTALLVGGAILSAVSWATILLKLYISRR